MGTPEKPKAPESPSNEATKQLDTLRAMIENPVKGLEDLLHSMLDELAKNPIFKPIVDFFRKVEDGDNKKETPEVRAQLVKERLGKEVAQLTNDDVDRMVQQGWIVTFLNPKYSAKDIQSAGQYGFLLGAIKEGNLPLYEHLKATVPLTNIFPQEVQYLQVRGQVYTRGQDGYYRDQHKLAIDMLEEFEVVESAEGTGTYDSFDHLKEGVLKGALSREALEGNKGWMEQLSRMMRKYPGLQKDDIYRVIKGESSWKTYALNAGSGASGFFQFIPAVVVDLNRYIEHKGIQVDLGVPTGTLTTEKIRNMDATTQLKLYDVYLQMWGYTGGGLGIMQAAPAFASKKKNAVVYPVGSAAWTANPGWRTVGPDGRAGTGPVTVAGINAYYRKQKV